jgi:hypothetical protein
MSSQRVAERGASPVQPHPDARRLEIEDPTGLLGVHVEPVQEDQRRPQAVGKLVERSTNVVLVARGGCDIGDGDRGEPSSRANGQSSDPFALEVQGRPVGVSRRRVHHADAVPPLEHPRHRLLSDLLGLERVTDQQDEGLTERAVLGSEERLEVRSHGPNLDRQCHVAHLGS